MFGKAALFINIIDRMDQSYKCSLVVKQTSDKTVGNRCIGIKVNGHGIGNYVYVVQ